MILRSTNTLVEAGILGIAATFETVLATFAALAALDAILAARSPLLVALPAAPIRPASGKNALAIQAPISSDLSHTSFYFTIRF